MKKYPNTAPRPENELRKLEEIWAPPRGLALMSAVNNTYVGLWYIGTALLFFVLAGVLALLMRTQLARARQHVPRPRSSTTRSSPCTAR